MPTIKQRINSSTTSIEGIPTWLGRVLQNRGVQSLDDLNYDFAHLPAPELMMGAVEAAKTLAKAIQAKQRILIIGDYDVDGATSCTLLKESLEAMGASPVDYLVPDRFKLGYGLSPEIVEIAKHKKPDWIITVDNGIASIEGVKAAKKLGIGVIVTDHHLPGDTLPDADVIVNPNQPGCTFPTKALAGVGVVFYVMLALRQTLRQLNWFNDRSEPNLASKLDLVALGTVADLVPLDHINRLLVKQGLDRINRGLCRPAIKVLWQLARSGEGELVAQDLGFSIAPRLNAAGRLDDMTAGIECLLSQTESGALPLAEKLNEWNLKRRSIQQDMEQSANKIVDNQSFDENRKSLCLYSSDWHEGVVGLVASKVKDRTYRPTIVFAPGDKAGVIKGSARSIKGIHIRDVLDSVATRKPDILQKFGGHAMAAGLTIDEKHQEEFIDEFESVIDATSEPSVFENIVWTDGTLETDDINLESAQLLRQFGPWGQRFPEPLFEGVFNVFDTYILKQRHIKFTLGLSNGQQVEAIAFNQPDSMLETHFEQINITYRLMINTFRGRSRVQLLIDQLL